MENILVKSIYHGAENLNLSCCFITTKETFNHHKKLARQAFSRLSEIEANDSSGDLVVRFNGYSSYLHSFEVKELSVHETKVLVEALDIKPELDLDSGLYSNEDAIVGFNLLINPEDIIEDYDDEDDEGDSE